MDKTKAIHIKDALVLLEAGQPCNLKVWKLKTGDILCYNQAICVGQHWRGGTHMIKLPQSGLLREFRDITLFEINGMEVYR